MPRSKKDLDLEELEIVRSWLERKLVYREEIEGSFVEESSVDRDVATFGRLVDAGKAIKANEWMNDKLTRDGRVRCVSAMRNRIYRQKNPHSKATLSQDVVRRLLAKTKAKNVNEAVEILLRKVN